MLYTEPILLTDPSANRDRYASLQNVTAGTDPYGPPKQPVDKAVVVHNKLITSQAPGTVFDFALALAERLAGIPAACRLHTDLHYGA